MNVGKNRGIVDEDGWTWCAGPAVSVADERLWCKLVAYDGEYVVSYVYEHESIRSKGNLIYEVDDWLADLWRSEDGRIFAPGEEGIHVYDINSNRWIIMDIPGDRMLSSVWGLDVYNIFATGDDAIFKLSNNRWESMTSGHDVFIDDITGSASNNLYAVGRQGLLLHYDGSAWTKIDLVTNQDLNAICIQESGSIVVVGDNGSFYSGKDGNWKFIDLGDMDIIDVIEFSQKIYFSTVADGVFILEKENPKLLFEDISGPRLTANEGGLCVAGDLIVRKFNGDSWDEYEYR